jgi:Protein of unknown function (DUF2628)
LAKYHLTSPKGLKRTVRKGFSWTAFLLGPLWALIKRSWIVFFLITIPFVGIVFVDEMFVQNTKSFWPMISSLGVYLVHMFICGKYGNQLLVWELQKRGYRLEAHAGTRDDV